MVQLQSELLQVLLQEFCTKYDKYCTQHRYSMKLEKRKYVKFAKDPKSPLFDDQIKLDILYEQLWNIHNSWNHRLDGPPPVDYVARINIIGDEVHLLKQIIKDKLANDSLWNDEI